MEEDDRRNLVANQPVAHRNGSDSTSEDDDDVPTVKRQRKHRFKTLSQRIADVDVSVYRTLAPKRAEPLPGSTSFFQEQLASWRELNAAADWLEAAAALQQITQSLPQLLHHQNQIIEILVSRLHVSSILSLEPVLAMLGVLARDLQTDFLPHIPLVITALTDLIDEGLYREPEQLEHVFACLGQICKHLVKPLASDLEPTLKCTRRLRHHKAEHVRALAGKTLGYLYRQAKEDALRQGIKHIIVEVIQNPTSDVAHGVGTLLAEAVNGVGHGIHSRAPIILRLVFKQHNVLELFTTAEQSTLGRNVIAARSTAVASVCLFYLLDHVRRGTGEAIWAVLLEESNEQIQAAITHSATASQQQTKKKAATKAKQQQNKDINSAVSLEDALCDAARAVSLLAQAVEYYKGSRVEDYAPLFAIATQLTSTKDLLKAATQAQLVSVEEIEKDSAGFEYYHPGLSTQTVRYLLALIKANCKVVGASKGPASIIRAAPSWLAVFSSASTADVLELIRGLITQPCGHEVAACFAPDAFGALGRLLVQFYHTKNSNQKQQQEEALDGGDNSYVDVAWSLLLDFCTALNQAAAPGTIAKVAMLTSVRDAGTNKALVDLIVDKGTGGGFEKRNTSLTLQDIATSWTALQCLRYTGTPAAKLLDAYDTMKTKTASCLLLESRDSKEEAMFVLHCCARAMHAELAFTQRGAVGTSQASSVLQETLTFLKQHPNNYHAVNTAAMILEHTVKAGVALEFTDLETLLPLLQTNLSNGSAVLRQATLRVICAFPLPNLNPPAGSTISPALATGSSSGTSSADQQQSCHIVVSQLLQLEMLEFGGEGTRTAVVALGRIKNLLEYRRIPQVLVPAVVHELLGILYIRFAVLWNPTHDTLGMALDQYPSIAWPLIFNQLSTAQNAFLAGDCIAKPRTNATNNTSDHHSPEQETESMQTRITSRFTREVSISEESASQDATDSAARLTHLLKALTCANNNGVEGKSKDWVPLFLQYSESRHKAGASGGVGDDVDIDTNDNEEEDASKTTRQADKTPPSSTGGGGNTEDGMDIDEEHDDSHTQHHEAIPPVVPAKAWRSALKDWLSVLGGLKGARGIFQSDVVKMAVAAHIMDAESDVQQAALKCLKAFKMQWLNPYLDRLMRLAENKTLRAELAAFPLATRATSVRDTDDVASIASEHRNQLIPLLIHLLFPKMRKRTGRLGGKGAPGSARAAILNFLAACQPLELAPLLHLLLEPLDAAFKQQPTDDDNSSLNQAAEESEVFQMPWWARHLGRQSGFYWLTNIDMQALNAQPLRRRVGYLNALEDLMKHLGHRMEPFLPELLTLAVYMLQGGVHPLRSSSSNEQEEGDNNATKREQEGAKEVRTLSLRLIASIIERFPTAVDYTFFWPELFSAIEPLVGRLTLEAAADRAPPVIDLCAALTSSPALVSILADANTSEGGARKSTSAKSKKQQQQVTGSILLGKCIEVLAADTCAEPARVTVLDAVENILELEDTELSNVLLDQHVLALLTGLQAVVVAANKQPNGRLPARLAGLKRKSGSGKGSVMSQTPRLVTATRSLAVMEVVAGRPAGAAACGQLVDALLPLLQPKSGNNNTQRGKSAEDDLIARTLSVLRAIWSQQSSGASSQMTRERSLQAASTLAPLAGSLNSREARLALGEAMVALANGPLPELKPGAEVLDSLVAMSTSTVDEADYDRRLMAHSQLTAEKWLELDQICGAPLLYCILRDLRDANDLALRHAAAQSLARFVSAATQAPYTSSIQQQQQRQTKESGKKKAAQGKKHTPAPPTTEEVPLHPVVALERKIVYPQLKRGLSASSVSVRQEHLTLVRALVLAVPSRYDDLAVLVDKDEEVDFLMNVAHLQLHRRARALARFTRALKSNPDSYKMSVLVGLVLPLLQQAIAEGKSTSTIDAAGHEAKQADRDKETNVADSAIHALAAVSSCLPWVQYQQILGQYLRLMNKHADGPAAKPVLRAVCAILDAFHFTPVRGTEAIEADAAPIATGDEEEGVAQGEEDEEDDENVEMDQDVLAPETAAKLDKNSVAAEDMYRMLAKRVVPELRSQMVKKDKVRAPVALAVVRALKLLPEVAMKSQLPGTLQKIANVLKARLQSVRDEARIVYVAMVVELGADYLPFALDVLSSALPPKGYTAHILGYTVHAVLEGLVPHIQPGDIDDCIPLITPVIDTDLFGDVAEAKEVDAFSANYKEAKRNKSDDIFRLLASTITFSDKISELLVPVRARLAEASNPKIRTKLASLLLHASRGVLVNPTATPQDLCEFVYAVVEPGLEAEEAARDKAVAEAGAAIRKGQTAALVQQEEASALHQHILVHFALSTFQSALRKGIIPSRDPSLAPFLDPLIPLLIRALRSRHTPTVTAALQALCVLIHSSLPGMATASEDAGKAALDLLKRCPKTTHPIAQDCFKLLAGMLRQVDGYAPSQGQLRFLLGWAFADLEETAEKQTAFNLLKAILSRKLLLPEVYDLMNRVQELMIKSISTQIRQLAASALLQFLLDYPLGEKRVRQHVEFLLSNVAYDHDTGREAALDMLTVVLQKFPEQVVSDWTELVFLPLITRLINDPSSKCRNLVAAAIKVLLQRCSDVKRDRVAMYCMDWLKGGDVRLRRASAQALGILVAVEQASFSRRLPSLMPHLTAILRSRAPQEDADGNNTTATNGHRRRPPVTHNNNEENDVEEEGRDAVVATAEDGDPEAPNAAAASTNGVNNNNWKDAYFCLVLLEKVLDITPDSLAPSLAPGLWPAVCALLVHGHAWIRKASARLLGAALAVPAIGNAIIDHRSTEQQGGTSTTTTAGSLAYAFFRQLDSESSGDHALASQAVKCMVWLTLAMYESDKAADKLPPPLPPLLVATSSLAAKKTGSSKNDTADDDDAEATTTNEDTAELLALQEAEAALQDEEKRFEAAHKSLTLRGLMRRITGIASDRSYSRQMHRTIALKFLAATAARLGGERVAPYLPVMLRPLVRIQDGGSSGIDSEEIKTLCDEIMAHLRSLVGGDELLRAYNAAQQAVRAHRTERKRKAAVLTMVNPEAAAQKKIRASQRKAAGKRRKLEEVRRMRSAGVIVKNKKTKRDRGGE